MRERGKEDEQTGKERRVNWLSQALSGQRAELPDQK